MRLLIIDNAAISYKDGRCFTVINNGVFIDELRALGNEIVYFQFRDVSDNVFRSHELSGEGIKCVALRFISNKFLRYLYAYLCAIREILRIDFVYLYYPSSFKFICIFCRLLHVPYGIYVRGMKGLFDFVSVSNYRHSLFVATVSDFFTSKINKISHNAHTIRPMISYTDADIIKDRKYPDKSLYSILFLGRLDADKGLSELLSAAKVIKDRGYNFDLHIIGSGEYYSELERQIDQLLISDIVFLDGPVMDSEKKAECFMHSDLFILPTYHEGFPRTLYEAMIFGTPIITTFVGGIPALMRDMENCKRIEPRSVESIVEAISFAFDNYAEMGIIARNASSLVSKIVDRRRQSHAQLVNQFLSHE